MDWPSLGFGFYCAMHATASLPLEEDLPPQGSRSSISMRPKTRRR